MLNITDTFKDLFFDKTHKDSYVVLTGTIANVIAGGVFFIIVPRILDPSNYGILSAALATGLAANAMANFGIDTGILRFSKDPEKLKEILSIAFKSYIILGIVSTILGFIFADFLAQFINTPQVAPLIKIAFTFNILLLLTNYYVAALQVKGQFAKASFINFASNIVRILLIFIFGYFISLNLTAITVIFFAVPIVSVILGQLFSPFHSQRTSKNTVKEFYKYNSWIALGLILASVPIDNYVLLKYAGALQAGLYAAPFKILTVSYQLGGNLTRVFATHLSTVNNSTDVKIFAKKSLSIISIFIVGLLFLLLTKDFIINMLFSESYAASGNMFSILIVGFIFFFLNTIPSAIILYHFGKSSVTFFITVIKYVSFILLLLILVPTLKAQGAAYAFTATELLSLILMSLYVARKLKEYEKN